MRKIGLFIALLATALGVLLLVLVVRALMMPVRQVDVKPAEPIAVSDTDAASRLAKAITFKTISHQIPWEFRGEVFEEFHKWLAEDYPRVHQALTRDVVSRYSLLYTWQGSDPTLAPIVLLAHMDVVPVDAASEQQWTHPPFEGVIADGYIWGRGAIDDKSSVIALLEAAETLLIQGFAPKRSIYFAFGHDEELGGPEGAGKIAALLKEHGVKAWFTLDEGSGITKGILPGIAEPIALISIGEKGYVTLELTVEGKGGHSSNPPSNTSIGILAQAVTKLEANPFEARLEGPMLQMLEYAGPHMDFGYRIVMANLWLFQPILKRVLAADPVTNAALRTTTAVTMMNAGTKENVLPIQARAVVNFRILPGDSVDKVMAHAQQVVDDDRVSVKILADHEAINPSPVSDVDSDSYALLASAVRSIMPETPVAPGMTLGGTDSKHFYDVADNLYRLQPMVFTKEDMATIHGIDERIEISNFIRGIQIHAEIMRRAAN